MKATVICRLFGVLAALALGAGSSPTVKTSIGVHSTESVLSGAITVWADGGEPTPPPIPIKPPAVSDTRSGVALLADGGEPTPNSL